MQTYQLHRYKLGVRADRSASTGRMEALREQSERMPADIRVHHGRATRVQRWTFPEGRSWRKPAEAERYSPKSQLSAPTIRDSP